MTVAFLALVAALDAGATSTSTSAPPAAAPAALRDGKQILADYARAIGDEQAWKKHKSVRVKRELSVKSMHFSSVEETRIARGGKIVTTAEMPQMGTFRQGSDGRMVWSEDPINGLRVLTGSEAEDVQIAATWNSEWRLDQAYAKVSAIPSPSDVAGSQAWECVQLDKKKGRPITLCFDRQTHLRAFEKGTKASLGGDVPYVTRFSDWRRVDGVLLWHREDATVGPMSVEGRIVEIAFDEPTPAKLFALPKRKPQK